MDSVYSFLIQTLSSELGHYKRVVFVIIIDYANIHYLAMYFIQRVESPDHCKIYTHIFKYIYIFETKQLL